MVDTSFLFKGYRETRKLNAGVDERLLISYDPDLGDVEVQRGVSALTWKFEIE